MRTDFVLFKQVVFLLSFLLCFFELSNVLHASEIKAELKEIVEQIKKEEAQLEKLRNEKKSTAKRIVLTKSKIENYQRLLQTINKDISLVSARINEIDRQISASKKNISKIKKDVAHSNIFIIDNLGYSYIKIISTAKKPEDTIKTLEILSKANSALDTKVLELNSAIRELAALTDEQKTKLQSLASMKKEKSVAINALKKEQLEYSRELTLLKNDEAGRLEYIEMLEFQWKELDKKIKQKSVKTLPAVDGSAFGRSKGSLQWPIKGVVTDSFGERLIKDAGLKFFHKGWKIKPSETSSVNSVASGVVVFADYMKGFGNLVVVNHGASYYTIYGNLSYLSVAVGQQVNSGYDLGIIDVDRENNTSYLYFEIRKNEQALNPANWLISSSRR